AFYHLLDSKPDFLSSFTTINSCIDVFRKTEKNGLNSLIISFNLLKFLFREFIICLLMKGFSHVNVTVNVTVSVTWFRNHSSDIWTIEDRVVNYLSIWSTLRVPEKTRRPLHIVLFVKHRRTTFRCSCVDVLLS
nr:hypothetical protein [Tanacetum cinerariifolium]